jgi:hypothetical protein
MISESVSAPSSGTEVSLCSALYCIFMAHVIYDFEQRVLIYIFYVKKKTHENHAGENFAINFPTQHVHLEIQFPN